MAQCMKFPLRSCIELTRARKESLWTEGSNLGGFDEILRYMAIQKHWKYGIINPGIVEHVGVISAVGNGNLSGMRVSKNYAGRDFDAMALAKFNAGYFT